MFLAPAFAFPGVEPLSVGARKQKPMMNEMGNPWIACKNMGKIWESTILSFSLGGDWMTIFRCYKLIEINSNSGCVVPGTK